MKKLLFMLMVGIIGLSSCKKENIKPTIYSNPTKTIVQDSNKYVTIKLTVNGVVPNGDNTWIDYTDDLDTTSLIQYHGGEIDSINWNRTVNVFSNSGFWLYGTGSNPDIWVPEVVEFKLYKNDVLIEQKTDSYFYFTHN